MATPVIMPKFEMSQETATVHLREQLGWQPGEDFESGLRKTVDWYLDNTEWIEQVTSGEYRNWIDRNYGQRALSS